MLAERNNLMVKRADRRAGEVVAILYNLNRDTDKDPQGIQWQDVFPEWKEEKVQSDEEIFEAMQLWVGPMPEGLSH